MNDNSIVEKNIMVIKRYFKEVWNNYNLSIADELYASDYILHNRPSWRKPGVEGLKEFIADNHRIFSDIHHTIEDLLADGDKVVVRFSATGTHSGELNGPVGIVPPTNKKVSIKGISICRFENGKIAEVWTITNNMELMQQIGAV